MDERIIRYFSGDLPEEERIALLRESERNPLLREELLAGQNVGVVCSLSAGNRDAAAGGEGYARFMKVRQRKKYRSLVLKSLGYAAAVGLIVVATWTVALRQAPAAGQPMADVSPQELFVPSGQRARITLPDGTVAWLNAGSTLHYPSSFGKERMVQLSGEAYFEVAKNAEKPFIVATKHIHIKALGTGFNVSSYEKAPSVKTTLLEGSVRVYTPGKESGGIVLAPDQQVFYENGTFRLEKSIDRDELLWKEGIHSFKKERLDLIVKKLELYYDTNIIVSDPRILRYEYTGKFRQRDGVMEILRIIQKIHNFKIVKNDELNQITISR